MPRRPVYQCKHPTCPAKAVGRGYCRKHQELSRAGSRKRASASDRGYDKAWERARKRKLANDPICEACAEDGRVVAADMVDHVVPIRVAPELRLRAENHRSLCWQCHGRKSAEDKAKYPAHYSNGGER